MDDQAVQNVQVNDEGINKQIDKNLVNEYVEGDNYKEKARQAKNLNGKLVSHNDQLSMEKTLEDTEVVTGLIKKMEAGEIDVDKKELKLARLESLKERNLAHLMVNSQKKGGDSKEMTRVKKAVMKVESAIAKRSNESLTVGEMEKIQEHYNTAIEECQKYLKKKTSFVSAWKYRKDMVRKTMERLLYENKLITTGKTLFALEKPKEPINSGLDLMAVARMYQLTNDMRTIKHERKYHIEKQRVGGFLFWGGEEKEVKVYDEEERVMSNVEKVSTQNMLITFGDTHAYTMFDFLQNDNQKSISNITRKGKTFASFSKEEKHMVKEIRKIRDILGHFYRDEVNTSIIKLGDVYANIIQRDDNSVYIEAKGYMMPIGRDAKLVLHDMENDVIANIDKYEDEDVQQVLSNMYINFAEMSAGDLIRMRSAFSVVISKKTGINRTEFDNIPVETLKTLAEAVASGLDMTESVKNSVKRSRSREKSHITNMLFYELSKLSKQKTDNVDYMPPNKYKNIINDSIEEKNEDLEKGWKANEAFTKKLLTELIYDPEATEADYTVEINEKERDKFKTAIRSERAAKIRAEAKDNYEASGQKLEGDKEAQKVVEQVAQTEIQKLNKEDPVNDEMYADYKRGLRVKELLKRNVDGLASIIADAFRDTKTNPESFIIGMVDKLPLFVVDEEQKYDAEGKPVESELKALKKNLAQALGDIGKEIKKQIDVESLGEDREFAIKAIRMCLPPVKAKITEKLNELDLSEIVKLGKLQSSIDAAVDTASDKIQDMMEVCTDVIFGKKEEKKEENKEDKEEDDVELEGFAALEKLVKLTDLEIEKKKINDEFVKVGEDDLSEEEKEYIRDQDAPFRIERLKKSASDKKAVLARLDARIKTAKDNLKAAAKNPNLGEASEAEDAYKAIKEAKDKYLSEQRSSLNKSIEDAVKGNKGQGLYIKNVLKTYFRKMPTMDKRSMIAFAIKNASPVEKPSEKTLENLTSDQKLEYFSDILGGLFKGAGPLFQKMVQGIPTTALPKGLVKAIDETKDNLLPIPEKFIMQQLDGIIKRSEGRIETIKVEKSLGAASVGQAFLCTIKGPKFTEGKQVVIKILRPDAKNRMKREYKVMREAARMTSKGMLATFEGTFKRIEEELDLTIEARHVVEGEIYNKQSENYQKNHVSSMKLSSVVEPTADCMVIELAGGTTVKRYLSEKRDTLERTMDRYYQKEEDENGKEKIQLNEAGKPLFVCVDKTNSLQVIKDRMELKKQLKDLEKRQEYLLELADKWVNEGVFGQGFYHGDLHSGNIMINEEGATIIDFGNCTQLTKVQQDYIIKMMIAAATSETDIFLDGFKNLLEKTSDKEFEKKKPELRAIFKDVLMTGDKTCAGQRIAVALLRAQELGLELPAAVANFSASQIRLQNTIDDTNKMIKDLRENIKILDDLTVDEEDIQLDETFSVLYKDMKSVNRETEKYTKIKDCRLKRGGMSKSDLVAGLKSKNPADRMMFMVKNLSTPNMILDMIDMYTSHKRAKGYLDLTQFLVTKSEDEEYDLEKKILADHGFKLTNAQFSAFCSTLTSLYYNGELPVNNNLPKDKNGNKQHYKSIRECMSSITQIDVQEIVGEDVVESKLDLTAAFVETELDKAVKAYLKAVDSKDPIPEEELKKLEDKAWEEYEKKEAKANEEFKKDKKNKHKTRKDSEKETDSIKFYMKYMLPMEGDSVKQMESDHEGNWIRMMMVKNRNVMALEDDKYGKALKEKYELYEAYHAQMDKYIHGIKTDGKDTPCLEQAKVDALVSEIADLIHKAKMHILDTLLEEYEKVGYANEGKTKEPCDFMDVMSDVLEKKKYTAVWKFGIFKALKHRKMITGED